MGQFKHYPWGVWRIRRTLRAWERLRTASKNAARTVTLATRISRERCRKINLGYRDPATINIKDFENREAEGILVVKKAGEMLYRLKA